MERGRGPAGLAHVHPVVAAARRAQRCPLALVAGERLALVAGQERAVGVDYPPPGHGAAPLRHDPAHLARAAFAQVLGDIAVGHHAATRNLLSDLKYPLGVLRQVRGYHGPGDGRVSPAGNGGSSVASSAGSKLPDRR